jgi:CubicO group peptidase (beta-lactamase class C family)
MNDLKFAFRQLVKNPGFTALALLAVITSSCKGANPHPGKSVGIEQYPGARDLYVFAETLRKKHGLPALGVGIVRDGKIIGLGMAGERRIASSDWATLDDPFDVASCSKSATATVAALLAERGAVRWGMKVKDVFPELRQSILPAYAEVTLDMLLRHRSGLDQWMRTNERWTKWHRDHANSNATEKRRLFVKEVFQHPPRYAPDTDTYYCNDGYLVAASMIEKVTGKAWEEAVRETLFEPLGLGTMRFGLSSPVWGHESRSFGRTRAVKPDPAEYGEPPFGSPGGFLSCTVADLLRFVDFHIQGANGHGRLLSHASFARLHAPLVGQHFALGWEVETKRNGQGEILERSIYHGGFSGRFRSNMWFCPESRTGTVIVYNHGGNDKADAYAEIFYALLREFRLRSGEKGSDGMARKVAPLTTDNTP